MQRDNNGAPFGRGFRPRSMFDDFFEDPFFSDPFIQRGGSFFQSPFSSAFHSAPFGGLLEEFLYGRRGGMRTMQGDFPFHARGQVHQALPDLRIVEMEPGEGMPSSQEQPHVEHPESDAEDEEEEEDDDGELPQPEASPGPSQKNVRDIPIQWGDEESPAPPGSAPTISELDPDVDMDWQPAGSRTGGGVQSSDATREGHIRPQGGKQESGEDSDGGPGIWFRDRERSFPRSWPTRSDRKGVQ